MTIDHETLLSRVSEMRNLSANERTLRISMGILERTVIDARHRFAVMQAEQRDDCA